MVAPTSRATGARSSKKSVGMQMELGALSSAPANGNGATRKPVAEPTAQKPRAKTSRRSNAQEMAGRQRDISISEFFTKNRHLLGFDNPTKALLTTVREAVDNALDACEEAGILPSIEVTIDEKAEDRFVVKIEDNGPGILKSQLSKIFGKLLYGSKFHRLKQSRGQQGIGISAAAMYGQITTGKPVTIISKTGCGRAAHRIEQQIDTTKNQPIILSDEVLEGDEHWSDKESGTCVAIELQATFKGGQHSVENYLRQTALANPHAELLYQTPKGKKLCFPRVLGELPPDPKEILPHPHGVELGILMRMIKDARGKTIRQFLMESFSRVSDKVVSEILQTAKIKSRATTADVYKNSSEALYQAIQATKIMAPPTSCLSPIGKDAIQRGMLALLRNDKLSDEEAAAEQVDQLVAEGDTVEDSGLETDGLFITAVTRPPAVYRGNPFQVEVGIAYGKGLAADQLARVYRFANRVPLLYQQSACAMNKSVMGTSWRNYDVQQSRGALPTAPMLIMIHIASAWVPYTSESKEAIAHYPEILKELRLALQEAGRKLAKFIRRRRRVADEEKKAQYIARYIDPIGEALQEILKLSDAQTRSTCDTLREVLERSRKL